MEIAEKLALKVNERTGIAAATITLHGQKEISPVRVSDSVNEVIIGVITLEALALIFDESTGELTESQYFLYVA